MKQKKSADEIRQEKLMEEIRSKSSIRLIPDDEFEKMQKRKNRKKKANERRSVMKNGVLGGLRKIICTPLSIAFHAVAFVSKGIGYISSFGLIAGVYFLYQSFSAMKSGVPFSEVDTFGKAISFIIFPFIAYGISVIAEKVWLYLEEKAV